MNVNMVVRLVGQMMRMGGKAQKGKPMTPQERAMAKRRKEQAQQFRTGARILRMFGRF